MRDRGGGRVRWSGRLGARRGVGRARRGGRAHRGVRRRRPTRGRPGRHPGARAGARPALADLAGVRGRVDGDDLLRRLPTVDGLAVLSFDRSSDVAPAEEAVREVLAALVTVVELVVVDLPRPDEPLFGVCVGAVDGVVLLGGAGVRQLAALSAVAPRLGSRCDEVWLALRSVGRDDQLADVTAGALDLPLVALVPHDPTLEADLLHGTPPGSAARTAVAAAADTILAQLPRRPGRPREPAGPGVGPHPAGARALGSSRRRGAARRRRAPGG